MTLPRVTLLSSNGITEYLTNHNWVPDRALHNSGEDCSEEIAFRIYEEIHVLSLLRIAWQFYPQKVGILQLPKDINFGEPIRGKALATTHKWSNKHGAF